MLRYLQEGLRNIESESEYAIGSDHNEECLWQSVKNKFTHHRFLLKHFDRFFVYCLST